MRRFNLRRLDSDWEERVDWADGFSPTHTHRDFYEEVIPKLVQRRIGIGFDIDKMGTHLKYVIVDYVFRKKYFIPLILPTVYKDKEAKEFAKKYHMG